MEEKKNSWVKNSIPLFFRMAITMAITLYTSRVVLNVLGVEDFGIYNVVGGIVVLFTFINSAMSSATQRFLSYDIGKGEITSLSNTFYSVVIIHLFIGIIIVLLCETIGLWYLHEKMQFSKERIQEVEFVFHLSVFSVFITVLQVPFNSLIIAFEKMKVFAYLGLVEAVLKLFIVFLLTYIAFDKLKLYSILTLSSVILIFIFYTSYCYYFFVKNWKVSSIKLEFKKFKDLLAYSSWNLFGNLAAMSRLQGHNLLLNYFYGPKVNASYSISLQIQNAINLFVNNIQLAISPQIIKKYAQGLLDDAVTLIFQGSRYCYFIMFIVMVPIYFNIEWLLNLWLVNVPKFAVSFSKLSLIMILIDSISGPLMTGIQATGKIKVYQLGVGLLLLINLPLSYFGLLLFDNPEVVFFTSIIISILALFIRLYFLQSTLRLKIAIEVKELFVRVLLSIVLAIVLYYLYDFLIIGHGIWIIILLNFLLLLCLIGCVFFIGFTKSEREKILRLIKAFKNG